MAQKVYLLNEEEYNLFTEHVKEVQQAHATYKDISVQLQISEMNLEASKMRYASIICPVCVLPMSMHEIIANDDRDGILYYLTNKKEPNKCTKYLYSVNDASQWRFNAWLEPEKIKLKDHIRVLENENKNLKALLKDQFNED